MGLEIQNTGKCLQQDSLHTIKQDTSQSDVQPRKSAGKDKLREASNAYGAYGLALVNKPDKVNIKSDEHKGLKKTEIGTKEEAIAILKKFGFSDELMKQVDFNDKDVYQMIFIINAYSNSGAFKEPEEIYKEVQEYSDKEKLELIELKPEDEFITYLNKENVDFLKQYIDINKYNFAGVFEEIIENDNQEELFEKLSEVVKENGKITESNLKHIVALSIDADLTDYLSKMKIKPSDDTSNSRFTMKEIKNIVKASQNNKDFAKYLINETENCDGSEEYYFDSDYITKILENVPDDTEFLKDLIEKRTSNGNRKYNQFQIIELATALKTNEKLTKEMLKETKKVIWSDEEVAKYYPADIENLVLALSIDKEYTDELIQKGICTSDILEYVQLSQKYGKERVEKFFRYTQNIGGVDYLAFTSNEIGKLLKLEETNKDDVEELLQYKTKSANGDERIMYHPGDIINIIKARKIDKEYTNKLLKINAELDPPKYGDYIKYFVEYQIPSELFLHDKISKNPYQMIRHFSDKGQKDMMKNIVDNFDTFSEPVDNLENTCLSHPDKYVNGEMNDENAKFIVESFFDNNYIDLIIASNTFDSKTMNVLLRKRIDDAIEYLNTMENFNSDDLKLLKDMSNCINNAGKPFIETQKIDFINLIDAYKKSGISTDIIKEMTKTGKIDLGRINLNLLENIMKKIGYTDEEIQNIPKEKLMSWDMNYIHLLAGELNEDNDEEDIQTFKDLIKSANSEDFEKYISDTSNVYGKANQKTKLMYEDMGMNYDKWIHPDKSHNIQFVAKDENLNKLEQVAKQVEEDMNNLMNTKAKGFLKKQLDEKFFKDDKFKLPEEYTTNKNKLSEFVEQLADESDKGVLTQMWKRAKGNSKNTNPEIKQNAQNTLTILSHLNQRKEDIKNISDIQSKKTLNWTIKMWDRNPQKDIFQGNYSTCCIGMGGGNGHAMPHFVMDTAYNMIELTDETGKTTGNALCYFAKDDKGQPAFIIDNIEINNSDKPSDEIGKEVRNKMAEYASLVAKDVTGRDDIPVYMSGDNNDVPTNDLKSHEEKVSFLGNVDSNTDKIYMDLYKGWVGTDNLTQNVELFRIR